MKSVNLFFLSDFSQVVLLILLHVWLLLEFYSMAHLRWTLNCAIDCKISFGNSNRISRNSIGSELVIQMVHTMYSMKCQRHHLSWTSGLVYDFCISYILYFNLSFWYVKLDSWKILSNLVSWKTEFKWDFYTSMKLE